MLAPVDVDHQPSTQAGKIEDVFTNWNLTPEAKSVDLPPAQPGPETVFSISRLGAEAPGALIFVA